MKFRILVGFENDVIEYIETHKSIATNEINFYCVPKFFIIFKLNMFQKYSDNL